MPAKYSHLYEWVMYTGLVLFLEFNRHKTNKERKTDSFLCRGG